MKPLNHHLNLIGKYLGLSVAAVILFAAMCMPGNMGPRAASSELPSGEKEATITAIHCTVDPLADGANGTFYTMTSSIGPTFGPSLLYDLKQMEEMFLKKSQGLSQSPSCNEKICITPLWVDHRSD